MKKFLIAIVALAFVASAAWAAPAGMPNAVGVFGTIGTSTTGAGGGIGLNLKWGKFPVVGIMYNFAGTGNIGASVDYHIVDGAGLAGALRYYLGIGAFLGLNFGGSGSVNFGARAPIGLQLYPLNNIELYLGAVPMVDFLPSISVNLGGELGIRIHF
jgi:opacity protein-like surface antigen